MGDKFRSIVIENVYPELDSGRYPVKRVLGERFEVEADIFKEGHDAIRAVLKYRGQPSLSATTAGGGAFPWKRTVATSTPSRRFLIRSEPGCRKSQKRPRPVRT